MKKNLPRSFKILIILSILLIIYATFILISIFVIGTDNMNETVKNIMLASLLILPLLLLFYQLKFVNKDLLK